MTRLSTLALSAIDASTALTAASIAGPAITDAQYARLDRNAVDARTRLLDCLAHDYGIDAETAEQFGAVLF
jgi:hypothetical protein